MFRAAREAIWNAADQDLQAGVEVDDMNAGPLLHRHKFIREDIATVDWAKGPGTSWRIYLDEYRRLLRNREPPKKVPRMPRAVKGRLVR